MNVALFSFWLFVSVYAASQEKVTLEHWKFMNSVVPFFSSVASMKRTKAARSHAPSIGITITDQDDIVTVRRGSALVPCEFLKGAYDLWMREDASTLSAYEVRNRWAVKPGTHWTFRCAAAEEFESVASFEINFDQRNMTATVKMDPWSNMVEI